MTRTLARYGRGGMAAGLLVILIGTFLPWLNSGAVSRNSYRAGGVARRVLTVPAWLDAALRIWPFVAMLCAVVAALLAAGMSRTGGIAGIGVALLCGSVTLGVLTLHGNGTVRPNHTGPLATIAGSLILLGSSTLLLRTSISPARSPQ